MKRCSKCGIEKLVSGFYHDRSTKDGYCPQYKECLNKYYKENKEEILKNRKKYYKENKEKIVEKEEKYYKKNKEILLNSQKEYRKTLNYKLSHARSGHKRRSLNKNRYSDLTLARWAKILELQNNKCNVCHKRFTKNHPPTQDHIIHISKNGSLQSENIQALCSSYNSSKKAKLDMGYIQTWVCNGTNKV